MVRIKLTSPHFATPAVRCLAHLLLVAVAAALPAAAQKIVEFDAPDGGVGKFQGTQPTALNNAGFITGYLTDSGNGTHGFLRKPDGHFEPNFDAPGADPVVGCTCAQAINKEGAITGYYIDSSSVFHGFVRAVDGKITTFDDSDAGSENSQGTIPLSINNAGVVAGYIVDSTNLGHGFLRSANGKITNFDIPGAGVAAYQGTYAEGVNDSGAIAGTITDTANVGHGFVRQSDGTSLVFDPPSAVGGAIGTYTATINDNGLVSGNFIDARSRVYVGFLRHSDGEITTFQPPNAGEKPYYGTYAVSTANLKGTTTGFFQDKNLVAHSFVRYAGKEPVAFDAPGQIEVPGTTYGSAGVAVNSDGLIAGRWHDPNYAVHGFLRFPNE